MTSSSHHIPQLGFGLGLRSTHWSDILEKKYPLPDWFEIISENFIDHRGYPREVLDQVRALRPLVSHGVSLNIGSTDALDLSYLKKLKKLRQELSVEFMSDHICWTGIQGAQSHDLLPLPYTEESLKHLIQKVSQLQDAMGERFVLENPSNYLAFSASHMWEADYIAHLAKESGCGLLLDINNVFVSSFNHGWNPQTYIDRIPSEAIYQYHLAGHRRFSKYIIDTHDAPVSAEVLELYQYALRAHGTRSTLLEWDDHIPDYAVMMAELEKIKACAHQINVKNEVTRQDRPHLGTAPANEASLHQNLDAFQSVLFGDQKPFYQNHTWVAQDHRLKSGEQLSIYYRGFKSRLIQLLENTFPTSRRMLGARVFLKKLEDFVNQHPPQHPSIEAYIDSFHQHALLDFDVALSELIDFEWHLNRAHLWPYRSALATEDVRHMPPAAFMNLSFTLAPQTKLLNYAHDVFTPYENFKRGENVAPPESKHTFLLVQRKRDKIKYTQVSQSFFDDSQFFLASQNISLALQQLCAQNALAPEAGLKMLLDKLAPLTEYEIFERPA